MAITGGVGFVDMLPRTDKFAAALATQMKAAAASASKALTGLNAGFLALGAVAVVGIFKGIKATQEWAGEIRALQRVTGLAAEAASKLAAAGAMLGLDVAKLNTGFGLLSKNIVNGSRNFEKYEIATTDATGATLPFLDVLGNVQDKFATLPEGAEQTAFAMNVFGKSGKDLIPILQRGRDGMAELFVQAEKLGLVMSQADLTAAKELTLAQRALGQAFEGASITIGRTFIPVLTMLTELLTGVVAVFQLIPQPIITVALAILAFNAAVAVTRIVLGFVQGQLTTFAATLGLAVVPTEALTVAQTQLAFATTAAGTATKTAAVGGGLLSGALGSLLPVLLPVGAAIGLYALGTKLARIEQERFTAAVAANIATLRSGQPALASELRQLAALPLPANRPVGKGGVPTFRSDIAAAQQAVAEFDHEMFLLSATADQTGGAIGAAFAQITDQTVPIDEVGDAVVLLNKNLADAQGKLSGFARVSGQDIASVLGTISKVVNDAKSTLPDVVAAYRQGIAGLMEANAAWHQSIVETFGGASAAFDGFLGKARVSFDKLVSSLADQRNALHQWRSAFDKIMRQNGEAASRFLQDMSANGLDSLGILRSVAEEPKKIRDQFLRHYNEVNSQTSGLASDIQDAFAPAFDKIIGWLRNIVRVMQGLPPLRIKADTSQADAAIDALKLRLRSLTGPGGRSPVGIDLGVVPLGHGGIVTRPTLALIGESGPEAVLPLAGGSGSRSTRIDVTLDRRRFNRSNEYERYAAR